MHVQKSLARRSNKFKIWRANMDLEYIIVQAGGKGTRMEALTKHKPKALVPVNNLPILFHLFRKFPDKTFIVIGDYKYDVLERYLREFARADYRLVCATGHSGTCAGLKGALSCIPEHKRFMLIWCDLVLPDDYRLPESEHNIIGISGGFPCRWKYKDSVFTEESSSEYGVAGYFIFKEKSCLAGIPDAGEFVRWLQSKNFTFEPQNLYRTQEYGLYREWERLPQKRCRPFNRMWVREGKFYKEAVDEQGKELAAREVKWYKTLQEKGFQNIPDIYGYDPLCMEEIRGKNIYECGDMAAEKKRYILKQIIACLKRIHTLGRAPADKNSYYNAYLGKTYERLKKVRCLTPYADQETITVNGRVCRNVFYHQEELERIVMRYFPSEFVLIHGDCTFSNIMLKNDTPVFLDPRGYFGTTELFGDAAYDWAKLYYSLYSNYDQFNLKRFNMEINEGNVTVEIASNHWELLEDDFFELTEGEVSREQMKILLAIIWLSLTTYAWEDYDSICGAFYMGIYYLEEAL